MLTSLKTLNLGDNPLTGTLPSELGALTDVTYLRIDTNQLAGTLPSELGTMISLRWTRFGYNNLTGPIPSEIGALSSLLSFQIISSRLTGTLPPQLGNLAQVTQLQLAGNQLTGTLPSELGALNTLQALLVCNNTGLCGDIPAGVTPSAQPSWGCETALEGTLLGSECPTPPTVSSYPSKPCCSDMRQHGNLNCVFDAMAIPQQDIEDYWCISSC